MLTNNNSNDHAADITSPPNNPSCSDIPVVGLDAPFIGGVPECTAELLERAKTEPDKYHAVYIVKEHSDVGEKMPSELGVTTYDERPESADDLEILVVVRGYNDEMVIKVVTTIEPFLSFCFEDVRLFLRTCAMRRDEDTELSYALIERREKLADPDDFFDHGKDSILEAVDESRMDAIVTKYQKARHKVRVAYWVAEAIQVLRDNGICRTGVQ